MADGNPSHDGHEDKLRELQRLEWRIAAMERHWRIAAAATVIALAAGALAGLR